jgi:hypothetical protein
MKSVIAMTGRGGLEEAGGRDATVVEQVQLRIAKEKTCSLLL